MDKEPPHGCATANFHLLLGFMTLGRIAYSQSCPCDHSHKQPATLVTTSIVKAHLNCHLNSVIKSSRKRLLPYATATTFVNYQVGLFLCF